MLDEFVLDQKIVTTILKNAVAKNRYSHAYLFETNGYKNGNALALAFAKYLCCPNHYSNNNQCVNCTQCKLIDQNAFSEIKIIDPDGLWIKKEQLDQLQMEFLQTAVQSQYRIYIIHNAEKMNLSAANSILKFLEEPAPNIIAILVTDNMYQLLDTIVSRCQIVTFSKNDETEHTMLEKIMDAIYFPSTMDKLLLEKMVDIVVHFVEYYEAKGKTTLLNTQNLWHNTIDDRDKTLLSFDLMLLFYKDILNVKLNRNLEYYDDYVKIVQTISEKNTIEELTKKIKIINELKEKIKLNVNQNLLIDELILEMGCTL